MGWNMSQVWKTAGMAVIGVLALLEPSAAASKNLLLGVRHWVAPDHTRVVIDMSRDPVYRVERQGERLFVDLTGTAFPDHLPPEIRVHKPHLEAILLSAGTDGDVRLSLCLPAAARTNIFTLPRYLDKPHRVVVDIVLPEASRKESEARGQIRVMRQDRIVVIDPGHGGESIGAVGKGGVLEKDVVLAIARNLRDTLNRREGYRAFLTRDGDYYVSFKQRLTIAREYGADLFLSIHADAARNRNAAGASVYCLSMGGASSEAAKILAQDENLADLLGGVPNGENSDASDPILLDMFQTHSINQSRNFGSEVLKHLGRANRLKFPTVQEAPFKVLKLPQIPSVLIETAYISNPREEKFLNSNAFRKQIAEAVATAVVEFLPPLPPVAQLVQEAGKGRALAETTAVRLKREAEGEAVQVIKAASAPPVPAVSLPARKDTPPRVVPPTPITGESPASYRVQKGDTLGKIAQREGTTIAVLLRLNGMQLNDPLPAGRKLTLPVAAAPEEAVKGAAASLSQRPDPAEKARIYQVRKGDSLGRIAQREETSLAVLLRLNGMQLNDPLPAGRLLRVPLRTEANKDAPPAGSGAAETRKGVSSGKNALHYRVQKGDSLTKVASKQGTTTTLLAELNGLKVTDHLVAGRILRLPAGSNR
jgi:N-acetylmuramoyl-L-alanine amidase